MNKKRSPAGQVPQQRMPRPTGSGQNNQPVPQPRPLQQNRVYPQSSAGAGQRIHGNRSPQPVPNGMVRKPINPNERMMQTRISDVDMKSQKKAPDIADKSDQKKTKRKKQRSEQGEGANTVISIVKAIVYIMFVIVVSVFLASAIIKVGNDVFAFVKSDEIIEITIPENATVDDVAAVLEEGGVISYPKIFSLYARVRHDDGVFLPGTYSVSPSQNFDMLRAEFKPKAASGTIEITIPEGFSTDEIIDLMVENGIGTREGYINEIENGEFDYWFIKELDEDGRHDGRIYRLDGYLFPDTYQFYLASSEWTVINKLLRRFSQIFTKEYRDQCDELGYSVDEIVTLASMIEKEAANPSEFFLVSSVFHNRMNAKWTFPRFESDATVVYAIAHETGERTVDLSYDSPYNTYMFDGFPPGPIANPSASAMLAALSPQKTDYYYFVSNDNVTYFSSSKAEHDAYIEKFRNETEQQTTGDVPLGN